MHRHLTRVCWIHRFDRLSLGIGRSCPRLPPSRARSLEMSSHLSSTHLVLPICCHEAVTTCPPVCSLRIVAVAVYRMWAGGDARGEFPDGCFTLTAGAWSRLSTCIDWAALKDSPALPTALDALSGLFGWGCATGREDPSASREARSSGESRVGSLDPLTV